MSYFDIKSASRLRRRRNRSLRLKAGVIIVLAAVIWFGTVWGFRRLESKGFFNVRRVMVIGNRMTVQTKIMEQAKYLVGKPLWKAGYAAVASDLVRHNPAIRRASFLAWPWGLVELNITERKPVAEVFQGEGMLIDGEGVVFRPDSIESGDDWGKHPQLKIAGCSQVGIWRALRLIESAPWVERDWLFDPCQEDDIRLWLPGGVGVNFGNGDFKRQWQKLGEVLASLGNNNQQVCQIDLRPRGQAVVRSRSTTAQAE